MRLSVEHSTTLRFAVPAIRLVQLLRMTPANSHDQIVTDWRIDVDCDARLRDGRDGFGNCVTMLYVDGPVDAITVTGMGEIVTSHSNGVLHGVADTLPPAVFRRTTALTTADPAIADLARSAAAGHDGLGALHALNAAIHERVALVTRRPVPDLTAAAALAQGEATPRDLAQIFVTAARSIGTPARYVSGYTLADGLADHRVAPHGWAEAHVEGIGWIGFDPSTGLSPEEPYVRLAIGLDAASAAPIAETRRGGDEEAPDVDVKVARAD